METNVNTSIVTQTLISWFSFAVAVLLIIIFLYTGINKLLEMKTFIFQLRLVPLSSIKHYSTLIAWLVPLTELSIVLILTIDRLRLYGFYASLLLMIAFEVYIGWMKLSGIDLPCTCGGIISQMSWSTHFIFNAILIILIIVALIFQYRLISNHNKHQIIHT